MIKLLRLPEVEAATGLSGTTIWRREREGQFPPRRRVGPNSIAWRSDEIERWIRDRPLADEASVTPADSAVAELDVDRVDGVGLHLGGAAGGPGDHHTLSAAAALEAVDP